MYFISTQANICFKFNNKCCIQLFSCNHKENKNIRVPKSNISRMQPSYADGYLFSPFVFMHNFCARRIKLHYEWMCCISKSRIFNKTNLCDHFLSARIEGNHMISKHKKTKINEPFESLWRTSSTQNWYKPCFYTGVPHSGKSVFGERHPAHRIIDFAPHIP